MNGKFIISLDFELYWGVRDKRSIEAYKHNLLGVWKMFPHMLKQFEKYDIKATFATVGFLLAKDFEELKSFIPESIPVYENQKLSPYSYIQQIEKGKELDRFYFAKELIQKIKKCKTHEIASHTFSHFYCLENGQTIDDFNADLEASQNIANSNNIKLQSLVFPRNQFNKNYLDLCLANGIKSYRGNEKSWFNRADKGQDETLLKRFVRLIDSYLNISGHNCYSLEEVLTKKPYNIPSSRFLRPYNKRLKYFEFMKLIRIKRSMTYSAKTNQIFHLWWHPHNFGVNQKENFVFLESILLHYKKLKEKYNFESVTMSKLIHEIES